MFKNKKGLELPITAIIVLIIAISFLGFALYLIKTLSGRGMEQLESQFSIMDDQTKSAMEQTGKTIAFNFGSTLKVKKGTKKDFKIGLRNNYNNQEGNSVCYQLKIKCLQAMGETNDICKTAPVVGGKEVGTDKWFTRMVSETDLPNGEFGTYESTAQITSATPDTYIMEAELFNEENNKDCANQGSFKSAGTERFNIEVT